MQLDPDNEWESVKAAAEAIRPKLGLPENWLNRESQVFGWQMPLGWRQRCEHFADFGPLRVMTLSRQDLITAKVMGAPKRMQDRQDLDALRPSQEDLTFVDQHLRQVEIETEPGHCDPQKDFVERLRSRKD